MAEAVHEVEAEIDEEKTGVQLLDFLEAGNIVDKIENPTQQAGELINIHDSAYISMKDWREKYERAMYLASLQPKEDLKTFPFEGASTTMLPFILEAMLDFHSRTVPELVYSKNIISARIYGKNTPEKEARAERMSTFLNHQISQSIKGWRKNQDKNTLSLACVGTSYKETFYDQDMQEVESKLHLGNEIVFDMKSYRNFEDAPERFIEETYTKNEVYGFIRGEQNWAFDEAILDKRDDKDPDLEFLKCFCWLDLDDDGLKEPYIVMIYKQDTKIVSCYPNYDDDDININDDGEIISVSRDETITQYQFLPDPEGGPMGLGWGILLGSMFVSINTTIQQLEDAGTLANLAGNSGLIDAQMQAPTGRGNRQQAGPIEVRMGELTPITMGGKSMRESISQFPYAGPNATMFQVMDYLITQVRGMTMAATNMDTNSQEAAVMYLARLQQGLKLPNSIIMRVYESASEEFQKIGRLNFKHFSDAKYNRVLDEDEAFSMRDDFNPEDCDIALTADPSQGSDMERIQRAEVIKEEAKIQTQPIINSRQAYMNWLKALGVSQAEIQTLAPEPSGEPDPMQQIMMANLQREASLANRDMALREVKTDLDRHKITMEMVKAMYSAGPERDKLESEIMDNYASVFEKLSKIGMAGEDPAQTVKAMEQTLINHDAPDIPLPKPVNLALQQIGQPQEGGQ